MLRIQAIQLIAPLLLAGLDATSCADPQKSSNRAGDRHSDTLSLSYGRDFFTLGIK